MHASFRSRLLWQRLQDQFQCRQQQIIVFVLWACNRATVNFSTSTVEVEKGTSVELSTTVSI